MWQRTFVGVSVLLGASVDDAFGGLPAGSEANLGDLSAKLRHPKRAVRAHALASVIQDVAIAIDAITLR